MKQYRTDLAMESTESSENLPGVKIANWEESGVTVTEVRIETQEASEKLGKSIGRYLTIESEGVRKRDPLSYEAVSSLLGEEISRLLPPDEINAPVLVVGLGNRMVTPDALGPKTVDGIYVTGHLMREMPEKTDSRLSPVCAVAPGVLGVTGIESMESVKALSESLQPRCLIVIDSLAARAARRVGVSIQLSDAGICPGSGVGNHRSALTKETIGVPVIAVGMPTVVYASSIARDALSFLSGGEAGEEILDRLTQRLFENEIGEMIVTPREVDDMISDAAGMISMGINLALHNGISPSEFTALLKK